MLIYVCFLALVCFPHVFCQGESYEVRLADGLSPSEGRLEVFIQGKWGMVCGEGSSRFKIGDLACKQLGYNFSVEIVRPTTAPVAVRPQWSFSCEGTETSLSQCIHNEVQNCVLDAIYTCASPKESSYEVRLSHGPYPWDGRLEVFIQGKWGIVCGSEYPSFEIADLVCKQLGYKFYVESTHRQIPDPTRTTEPKWSVSCQGIETNLLQCTHNEDHYCRDDFRITCASPKEAYAYEVRLTNGPSPSEGLLEVFFQGKWGIVCNRESSSRTIADLTCKQLGYIMSVEATYPTSAPGVVGPRWFVKCDGTETTLWQCAHNEVHSCYSGNYMITCASPKDEFEVRLSGGTSPSEGRLDVYTNGEWGTVCDYAFSYDVADLACQQLGYNYSFDFTKNALYGESIGTGWQLTCGGNRTSLRRCYRQQHHCNTRNTIGACCATLKDKFDVRLSGGTSPSEGRLDVYINGEWGTVCDREFSSDVADLACQQLGYNHSFDFTKNAFYGESIGTGWQLTCDGERTYLWECYRQSKSYGCGDVGVRCAYLQAGIATGTIAGITIACLLFVTMLIVITAIIYASKNRNQFHKLPNL
ncbi:scavenger receptor cysteine-rich domain superfamily protein-like isoform X2 [Amphiura filiformis]|uniref:scavenger receptor cysteine-rich domain superfamily protein-like isoform X2 n=1 Tax=Amphiura filiformis TaxID=82378 RepID=UPI003B227DF3